MNRSKRPMESNVRKKMNKSIRNPQIGVPTAEGMKDEDEETAKEMLLKFPKKADKKKAGLVEAMKRKMSAAKAKPKKNASKRTTPGSQHVDDLAPAYANREGKRWLKTIIKQNLSDRVVADHRGRKK